MIIIDIALKDLVRSFRSLFAVGMMFGAPLLITGLIFFAFGGLSSGTGQVNLPALTVAVVNQDEPVTGQPAFGQMLLTYLTDPALPAWLHVSPMTTEAEARAAVNQRAAGVALIIPPDFSRALLAQPGSGAAAATPALTLINDPTLTIGPRIVQDLVQLFVDSVTGARIALNTAADQAAARHVAVDPAALQALGQQYATWAADTERNLHLSPNPLLAVRAPASGSAAASSAPANSMARLMGGVMAGMLIFFVFFTGANAAQSILREDEEGTLARLFTTPVSRTAILGGKFLAVFVTIAVQAVVLVIVSALLFKIDWGQPLSLGLVLLGVTIAAAGFGVCLVSFVKGLRQSGPLIGGVLAVTGMLGGLFTSGVQMPAAFETVNLVMPQGWAFRGLKLALDGAGFGLVLTPVLVSVAIGAVLFAIGAFSFRRRYA
jgi:ABC-2 type transport system permease protein